MAKPTKPYERRTRPADVATIREPFSDLMLGPDHIPWLNGTIVNIQDGRPFNHRLTDKELEELTRADTP